ncbi:dihydrodipicolinate reductase C-terminal domain-containing protein [Rhodohalobacter sp.]|uniref:dihydrodipicolinate reductase C-terminal domain-containing protein n=1 Tax=Rhodohalobacter sp. TaxID=1974210 RepID=UPI002ACED124|nr:dihydrodipicolinate reductase C-terminal domain-containing protein [Rhodohalobacter sp.]MDZ7756135.1 dihydrodipicolinate reductase C-terminal domain-containing protein [Rhodohalobacter sp.]
MKIAVIGTGKTGGKVVELLGDECSEAFDEHNPPTVEKLKQSDAVIIFVPGDAVPDVIDDVLEAGIPAAWGSTGFDWPEDLADQVKKKNTSWVLASNFSLGMNVIRKSIQVISKASSILKDPEFHIHEVHHVHKKDAPSGTALSWKEWLDKEAEVTSAREGDVKGIHELTVKTGTEKITLKHKALDRALFAEGAIWAAKQMVENPDIENGVHAFGQLFDQIIMEEG